MKKKTLLSMLLTLLICLQAKADSGQTIVINGTAVEKTLTQITFNGDQVVLKFSDNSSQTTDMANVTITFSASESSGIGSIAAYQLPEQVGNMLNIANIAEGTIIQIFNASGMPVQKSKAGKVKTAIDITSLKKGIYVLRAGSQVVKFMKK